MIMAGIAQEDSLFIWFFNDLSIRFRASEFLNFREEFQC